MYGKLTALLAWGTAAFLSIIMMKRKPHLAWIIMTAGLMLQYLNSVAGLLAAMDVMEPLSAINPVLGAAAESAPGILAAAALLLILAGK